MKTVGILGGLGPETTSKFYLELIQSYYEVDKRSRPPVLIWSVPLPYQIEEDLIVRDEGVERYIPFLVDAAKRLENGGADFLVIPCNSVHIFIEEIRQAVSIPVLSIAEETANFLKQQNITKVGLLGTSTTINKRIYTDKLKEAGIEEVIPPESDQEIIGQVIHNLVLNQYSNEEKDKIDKIIDNLGNREISTVVLACTDLQLVIKDHPRSKVYDSMKIMIDATVKKIHEA